MDLNWSVVIKKFFTNRSYDITLKKVKCFYIPFNLYDQAEKEYLDISIRLWSIQNLRDPKVQKKIFLKVCIFFFAPDVKTNYKFKITFNSLIHALIYSVSITFTKLFSFQVLILLLKPSSTKKGHFLNIRVSWLLTD